MKKKVSSKIIAYTDGGSRGNPGPAAIGVVIEGIGNDKKEYTESIGMATNNTAEYKAVILSLKKIKALAGKDNLKQSEVEIRIDSELIVSQLNGVYKVEDKEMQGFFMEIWNLKFNFPKLKFIHIPREQNTHADSLVNQCLDEAGSKLF